MIVNRSLHWVSVLRHAYTTVLLAAPAYFATIQLHASRGRVLAWNEHAGLIVLCLLAAYLAILMLGFVLLMVGRLIRPPRGRRGGPA